MVPADVRATTKASQMNTAGPAISLRTPLPALGAQHAVIQPPVTLICRARAGRLWRRSITKSWPLGLRVIASSIAA